MKAAYSIFLVCIALSFIQAKEIPVASEIDAVTVFTQGAQLFRKADISLEKGEHLLIFENLTTTFDPASIRVGGTGSLTILSVSSRTNYAAPPKQSEQILALQNQIETVTGEIENLQALNSVYTEEEDLLLKNKQLAGTQTGLDVNQLKLAADYLRTRLTEVKTKRLGVNRDIRKKQDELNALRNQLSQLSGARGKTTGEIVVKVAVDKTTKAHFEITYLVHAASWTPYYDLRMNGIDKAISLEYKAKVQQQTGVEWKDVQLTLSGGNPSQNGMLSTLTPWYIDFARNDVNIRGGRGATESYYIDGAQMDEELAEVQISNENYAAKPAKMKTTQSVVQEQLLNVSYQISIPYSISSSSLAQDVAIRTVDVPATYEYRANVKRDETAFLVAKMYNWQEYSLLNGNAKLFNEGTYIGEVFLDVANTEDTLLLSLGRDDKIVIKRERELDMNGTQFLGANKKYTRYWKTSIRNNKKQSIRLVLTDQIPVSRQKDISVKLEDAGGGVFQEQSGYLVWQLQIAPSESKELRFGYSVKHPKDQNVTFND
jgi:uncharacterized protein (TIGR02231 family)